MNTTECNKCGRGFLNERECNKHINEKDLCNLERKVRNHINIIKDDRCMFCGEHLPGSNSASAEEHFTRCRVTVDIASGSHCAEELVEQLTKEHCGTIEPGEIITIGAFYKCFNCLKLFYDVDSLDIHCKQSCARDEYHDIYSFEEDEYIDSLFPATTNSGYVYIMNVAGDDNLLEVSVTDDVNSRLVDYRRKHKHEPLLYYYWACEDIKCMNTVLNAVLKRYNVGGAIYKAEVDELSYIVLQYIEAMNRNISPTGEPYFKHNDVSICTPCGKIFQTRHYLDLHTKSSHTRPKQRHHKKLIR